jgi:hypothetical protein
MASSYYRSNDRYKQYKRYDFECELVPREQQMADCLY